MNAMNETGWDCFLELCLASGDKRMLTLLLKLLLTHEERESIATRCLTVKELLAKKKTQRAISKEFKVCIAKITRGSNELKNTPDELKQFLENELQLKKQTSEY